jgi:hypothetical protein
MIGGRAPARWTRRAFLGGAGVSLALPWLPSLRRGEARADAAPPVRLIHWYCPNGMNMGDWTPTSAGYGWDLTPILAPLAGVRDEVCVLSGLANRPAIDFATGDHPRGTASFLSCAHILQGPLRAGRPQLLEPGGGRRAVAAQRTGEVADRRKTQRDRQPGQGRLQRRRGLGDLAWVGVAERRLAGAQPAGDHPQPGPALALDQGAPDRGGQGVEVARGGGPALELGDLGAPALQARPRLVKRRPHRSAVQLRVKRG